MKKFKIIDTAISIALILFFCVYQLAKQDDSFFIGYFVVGSWQVISMLVHIFTGTFTYKSGARNWYHWVTLISIVTMPIGSFLILLFTAPFMAVYYTWICYHEVTVKMKRPLAVLK